MAQQANDLRECLLAALPQPENLAAYREETAALLAKHARALRWNKFTANMFVFLACALAFLWGTDLWHLGVLAVHRLQIGSAVFFMGAIYTVHYKVYDSPGRHSQGNQASPTSDSRNSDVAAKESIASTAWFGSGAKRSSKCDKHRHELPLCTDSHQRGNFRIALERRAIRKVAPSVRIADAGRDPDTVKELFVRHLSDNRTFPRSIDSGLLSSSRAAVLSQYVDALLACGQLA